VVPLPQTPGTNQPVAEGAEGAVQIIDNKIYKITINIYKYIYIYNNIYITIYIK